MALEEFLDWNNGLQQIVEATAVLLHQHPSIFTAAKYGLKWSHHMKEQVQVNTENEVVMNGNDSLTGLRLFMVAAMGEKHDLDAIYSIMIMNLS